MVSRPWKTSSILKEEARLCLCDDHDASRFEFTEPDGTGRSRGHRKWNVPVKSSENLFGCILMPCGK